MRAIKKICGIPELPDVLKRHPKTPLISITNPDREIPESITGIRPVLRLTFHDLDTASYEATEAESRFVRPTAKHLSQAMEWAANFDQVIIHCQAGVSRSPTLAFGILLSKGMPPVEAASEIRRLRDCAKFNTYMLGLLSDALERPFEELCEAYRTAFRKARVPLMAEMEFLPTKKSQKGT